MNRHACVAVFTLAFSTIAACGGKVIESGHGDDDGGAGAGGTTGDGGTGATGGTGYGGTGATGGTGLGGTAGTGYGGTGYGGTAGTGYGGTGYGGTAGTGYGGTGYGGTAGTGGVPQDCTSTPECWQCCEVQNAFAMQLFLKLIASCACTPSECGYTCTEFCAQPLHLQPGACQDCMTNSAVAGGCASVIGACLGDAICAPALQCLLSCP